MTKKSGLPSNDTVQMNRRFEGYRNTPFLWKELLEGLKMFEPSDFSTIDYPKVDSAAHLRLGKLIEQFVLFELEEDESAQILRANVQVFREQRTVGELDCLVKQSAVNIHLEIVFKFYLYDPSISTELNRWIGPNRNDSLVLKLNKLKEKQLPLLHHPEAAKLLNELKVKSTEFKQRVFFKAQLFIPLTPLETSYKFINKDCITGFYIRQSDLALFTSYTFYIPTKLDWLVDPHLEVEWISAQNFHDIVSELLASHRSPLCWMKSAEGKVQKFFIVWWK